MALKLSVAARNAGLDAIETAVGVTPILAICSGTAPANCAAAETGTRLATVNLPSDWMAAAASGAKSKLGTWEDTSADATGTAGYYRIYDSAGTTCHLQGTVTATGGGGDMEVQNTSFAAGQDFQVTSYTLTAGNA